MKDPGVLITWTDDDGFYHRRFPSEREADRYIRSHLPKEAVKKEKEPEVMLGIPLGITLDDLFK